MPCSCACKPDIYYLLFSRFLEGIRHFSFRAFCPLLCLITGQVEGRLSRAVCLTRIPLPSWTPLALETKDPCESFRRKEFG